jgi:formylglycine-generating enzyme required for sulfatase activity
VGSFSLDKYLVTVGRFRQFVAAWNNGCGWLPSQGSGIHTHLNGGQGLANTAGGHETGWMTSDNSKIAPTSANLTGVPGGASCDSNYATWTTASSGGHERLPINCVNWYEAYAFCVWDGGFLPSEAELEYAAAGGGGSTGQREYPWGQTAPGTANQYAVYGCLYPSSVSCGNVANGSVADIPPVGFASMGAGAWGQLDLAGELFEWSLDGYATYVDPCTNCVNLSTTSSRVLRGGNFFNAANYILPTYRQNNPPSQRHWLFGIRCARTL